MEEFPSIDPIPESITNDISPPVPLPAGSDRQTRGFRVHIEPRTHTVTRTNKKQKLTVKQEPIELNEIISEPPSSIQIPIKGFFFIDFSNTLCFDLESKRSRLGKNKRSSSPLVTTNILSNPSSPNHKTRKKRRSSPTMNDFVSSSSSSSDITIPKLEIQQSTFPIPLIDTRNPVTWNVNDVCSYLNQSGCSFALKTIKEQVILNIFLLFFQIFFFSLIERKSMVPLFFFSMIYLKFKIYLNLN